MNKSIEEKVSIYEFIYKLIKFKMTIIVSRIYIKKNAYNSITRTQQPT